MVLVDHTRWKLHKKQWTGTTDQLIEDLEAAYATRSAGRSTKGSRSRQASASESALAEEPVQTTSQMEEPSHPEFDTGADDLPIIQSSQHPEWFSRQRKPLTSDPTRSTDRSTKGSRSRQASASESALAEKPVQTTSQMEEPSHPEFDTCADDLPIVQSSQHPEWFSRQQKPPTPDRPTCELMKGSCKSLVELEYHLEEVFKAITDQLDWVNPEGQQYPHNLLQPLPLIPNNRGRHVIPFEHFINNDLKYLRGGASSRKYTTSITKTKAVDYGHIKWIEDLVPRTMWIEEPIGYDKHALRGDSHWGQWHSYKHLDWITVRRDDDKLYKFKEGDFKRLRIQDIEDIIVIQRRVEDLQLGVESYQKKLNLTKPNTYRSDLKLTHWFTLIALSALRRSDNENTLSLMNMILRSILTDLQITPTKPGRMAKPYSSHCLIANCFNAGNFKMEVKVPVPVVS
nr:hypothetical protein [Tanacetum cinerariifolium]